ncbi:MAG: formate C-acetyltransferase/glycerol dehydratase family glycyl radical enzyme [Deltaproteobacteria bacterium]|jgi:formate C-acetyltransferase|nr:formate C-acetyltransferase/glycerol dehydratase family glycyl radical enzyme [Deltaproteobacteria bacterium]
MISERIRACTRAYIQARPSISVARADIFTRSHKKSEGEALIIRRAKAFREVCRKGPITIFENELIVGSVGEHLKSGVICPEYSWRWVDAEMDGFAERGQDPYLIDQEAKKTLRRKIFPYWKGKSLEETFLSRLAPDTANILVDTGIIDNDSKWRNAVGEITADYQDIVFRKGFSALKKEAGERLARCNLASPEGQRQADFYQAEILACEGLIALARRYSEKAELLAAEEKNPERAAELREIAAICQRAPAKPPTSFHEAVQAVWFTQMGSILSENSLALNLGRFDQYMYPYYAADLKAGRITREKAQELLDALWIKLSEWVWVIAANTAQFFAGYNAFQNLTLGGRTREGGDAVNELSYMCLTACSHVKTHQPGLSVRIHPDTPDAFMMAVCDLIAQGTGFPAVHNDRLGAEMLLAAGLPPEDARDWNNCGCVVPHFRKIGEWTSAVNVNLAAALEFALNRGQNRLNPRLKGLPEKDLAEFASYEELKQAFFRQLAFLIRHSVIGSITAQRIHAQTVPRPYLSLLVDGCMDKGKDLSQGGAKYNLGPVLTGIGVADSANSLATLKKLVFEQKKYSLADFRQALAHDWIGFEQLRKDALACPKYGNDDDYADAVAVEITNFYYREVSAYTDIFGSRFLSAFMGISNYIPAGKVVGATPDGRKSGTPLTEGVSPHAGTDITSPTAAMRSAAKINHDMHTGGTLINLKLSPRLLDSRQNRAKLGALIRAYFALGGFHVQFNVISAEVLRKAQENPEDYRDLLVRVAGYSTQFVNLSREAQEAIIARTTYENI